MSSHVPENAIVVGVDGSAESWHALRWAADRAGRTHRPLHIIHAQGALFSSYSPAPEGEPIDGICEEALEIVTRRHPELGVTWSQPPVSPVPALLEASMYAGEILLGTKGADAVRGAVLGSVAIQVSTAARCPVLVIRGAVSERRSNGPVVVGVDLRPDSLAALEFAFGEAERCGVPLLAVRCWQLDRLDFASGIPMPGGNMKAAHRHHQSLLDQALVGPSSRHPNVEVQTYVACARAAGTLVERSATASLLVVGTRGHHEVGGLVLGSVSQSVMRRSSCPVAVVPRTAGARAATSRDEAPTSA